LILTQGNDPFFDDTARDLVICLIIYVCIEPDETRTLPRVRQLLTLDAEKFNFRQPEL
jgi:type IV secretory pathway TraG/TraD family ATPase VirD4